MQLARVIGTVVATIKNDSLKGRKFLVIQSLDAKLNPQGKPLVAVDSVGAGEGELVFWCRGKEASFPFKREDTPTDCTIIGIVDSDFHVTNNSEKKLSWERGHLARRNSIRVVNDSRSCSWKCSRHSKERAL